MARRYAAAAVALLAAVCVPATAAHAAVPRTGFEIRAGKGWTTLAEESAYLARLDQMSPRLRIVTIGRSTQGRPIRLLIVGPARSAPEISKTSAALFVCTQHGNEPSGREACLQRARDLAFGAGNDTVLIVPTANPDGVAANTRENGAGVDINTTYQTLTTPEARAITGVLAAYRPDVLDDLHEYRAAGAQLVLTRGNNYGTDVAAEVRSYAAELRDRYESPSIEAGGYRTGQWAGPVVGITLTRAALRRRIPSALTETPRAGALSALQRVDAQRRSVDGTLRFLAARRADLARLTATDAR